MSRIMSLEYLFFIFFPFTFYQKQNFNKNNDKCKEDEQLADKTKVEGCSSRDKSKHLSQVWPKHLIIIKGEMPPNGHLMKQPSQPKR